MCVDKHVKTLIGIVDGEILLLVKVYVMIFVVSHDFFIFFVMLFVFFNSLFMVVVFLLL